MKRPHTDKGLEAMRRKALAFGLLALVAVAAYRFDLIPGRFDLIPGQVDDGSPAQAAAARRRGLEGPIAVAAAQVRIADVPVTIDAVGTVQALNTVAVRTQIDGRLVKLAFDEGQYVKKDDLLALIDPTLYKAAHDQAVAKRAQDEANLANARVDMQRYQRLAASNFGSQQQYETQKSLVAQLEAQIRADQGAIDNAKATLDYATIRSPIDGRTGIRLVDIGNILHVSDQTGIVVVTQLKPLFVVFTVPQPSLPAVQKAQAQKPASVAALAADNASVIDTGVVAVIDNQIDQTTGTVKIKATFENRQLSLWPGQFVNVRLTVDTIRQAKVVPSAAARRGPDGAFVYVVDADQTVSMKPVAVGRQDEQLAVVTSDLEPTANVVTSGFARLSDGVKVRVAEQTPPAAAVTAGPPPAGLPQPGRKSEFKDALRGERDGPIQTR